MLYFFSSGYPLILKADGKIIGKLDNNIIALNLRETAFIETAPLTPLTAPINFIADAEFINIAYNGLIKTDLKGGYFIKFVKINQGGEFKVISQKKFNNISATAYYDNGYKISIETTNDFFVDNVNLYFETALFSEFTLANERFLAIVTTGKEKFLTAYAVKNKISKVFCEAVDDFNVNGGFSVTKKHDDIAKHNVKNYYGYNNNQLSVIKSEITRRDGFSVNDLPFLILPFAFFEAVLTGDNLNDYITLTLQNNADKLRGYLGDFIGVIPPPEFRNNNEVGLVYKKTEGLYSVEYFIAEFDGRLINNIKKV